MRSSFTGAESTASDRQARERASSQAEILEHLEERLRKRRERHRARRAAQSINKQRQQSLQRRRGQVGT